MLSWLKFKFTILPHEGRGRKWKVEEFRQSPVLKSHGASKWSLFHFKTVEGKRVWREKREVLSTEILTERWSPQFFNGVRDGVSPSSSYKPSLSPPSPKQPPSNFTMIIQKILDLERYSMGSIVLIVQHRGDLQFLPVFPLQGCGSKWVLPFWQKVTLIWSTLAF